MKETEDDSSKWKACSRFGRTNIVKMSKLPKTIYSFITILIKMSMVFFTELEQMTLKCIWKERKEGRKEGKEGGREGGRKL